MSTHTHNIDFKSAFTVTKEPGSMVKIAGEIPYEELAKERTGAIKHLGQNLKIDGFRAGHVPENMLVKHLGEMTILTEMAERAIHHFYPHILEAHNIAAIGYPKIEITKIAQGNPLGFTAKVAIVPEFSLPEYKKLVKDLNANKASITVTDEEVEEKAKDILRQKAAFDRIKAKADPSELPTPESTAVSSETDLPVPELTDEVAQTLGQPGQFTTVADFKAKLREHLEIEKKNEVTSNHRAKLTDTIIDATTIELPQILIDSELGQMFGQMEEDLSRSGLKMEDYLAHIKKTKDDLRKEWSAPAEKRAKLQLVLNAIAKEEKILPDEQKLKEEVTQLLTHYKDADPYRVELYVASVMQNEAVLKMLEEVK